MLSRTSNNLDFIQQINFTNATGSTLFATTLSSDTLNVSNLTLTNITGTNITSTSNLNFVNATGTSLFLGSLKLNSDNLKLGSNAGNTGQSSQSIAIGKSSSEFTQGQNSVAIGTQSGRYNQGINCVAIGLNASYTGQSDESIAIGSHAGYNTQGPNSIAIGSFAGNSRQFSYSIGLGTSAGYSNQGTKSIAIGYQAGYRNQGENSVAIGNVAGYTKQSNSCIAIGDGAGYENQRAQSIAIGTLASYTNSATGSICINGSGSILNAPNKGFYVNPVRAEASTAQYILGYNSSSEIVYNNTIGSFQVRSTPLTVQADGAGVQFSVIGSTNSSNALSLGYDTSDNVGRIEAITHGSTYRNIIMQPANSIYNCVGIGISPTRQLELGLNSAMKPTSSTWEITSDIRLKEDINDADLDICYNIVKNLKLRRYKWKEQFYPDGIQKDRYSVGFIANEVQNFYPKAVGLIEKQQFLIKRGEINEPAQFTNLENVLTVDVDQIYKTTYGCVKKLIEKVEFLENEISKLK